MPFKKEKNIFIVYANVSPRLPSFGYSKYYHERTLQMKLRLLNGEMILDYPDGPNVITLSSHVIYEQYKREVLESIREKCSGRENQDEAGEEIREMKYEKDPHYCSWL